MRSPLELQINQVLQGTVKLIAEYGAFINVAPHYDGLLHVSMTVPNHAEYDKKAFDEYYTKGRVVWVRIDDIIHEKNRVRIVLTTRGIDRVTGAREGGERECNTTIGDVFKKRVSFNCSDGEQVEYLVNVVQSDVLEKMVSRIPIECAINISCPNFTKEEVAMAWFVNRQWIKNAVEELDDCTIAKGTIHFLHRYNLQGMDYFYEKTHQGEVTLCLIKAIDEVRQEDASWLSTKALDMLMEEYDQDEFKEYNFSRELYRKLLSHLRKEPKGVKINNGKSPMNANYANGSAPVSSTAVGPIQRHEMPQQMSSILPCAMCNGNSHSNTLLPA